PAGVGAAQRDDDRRRRAHRVGQDPARVLARASRRHHADEPEPADARPERDRGSRHRAAGLRHRRDDVLARQRCPPARTAGADPGAVAGVAAERFGERDRRLVGRGRTDHLHDQRVDHAARGRTVPDGAAGRAAAPAALHRRERSLVVSLKKPLPKNAVFGLIGGGALLVAVIGYMLLIKPQRSQLHEVKQQISETQKTISDYLQAAAQSKPTAVPKIKVADIYRLARAMPSDVDMPDVLIQLNGVAASSGVTIDAI